MQNVGFEASGLRPKANGMDSKILHGVALQNLISHIHRCGPLITLEFMSKIIRV